MSETIRDVITDGKYVELKYRVIDVKTDSVLTEVEFPLGYVHGVNEVLAPAVMRELEGSTGISGVYLEQLYTFGKPGRHPSARVIAVAYYALIPSEKLELKAASDAEAVGWFGVAQLQDLAFDHAEIVRTARERLVAKLDYSTIAFQFMPAEFTLSELQGDEEGRGDAAQA